MTRPAQQPALISAATFVVRVDGTAVTSFSELAVLTSAVSPTQYVVANPSGQTVHSRQYGSAKPPRVTLKRGLDSNSYMWGWHQLVLQGDPAARRDCTLEVCDAAGQAQITYQLINAWPAKIEIAGTKENGHDLLMEEVDLVFDSITMEPS